MSSPLSICVVGSGYVGLVAAVCFAEMGHNVLCVDNDRERVRRLQEGEVPIFEEHLPDLLARHRGHALRFTSDLPGSAAACEAIFIAVGTPQSEGGAADLSYVEAVVAELAPAIRSYKVIVEKSTVPVGTHEWIRRTLCRHGVEGRLFDVVSNPEFLREGTAIVDFLHPDRIVIGANREQPAALMTRIYQPLTDGSYYAQPQAIAGGCNAFQPAKALQTRTQSAEIIKHSANAFLALKVSFINAISNLAETVGADIEDIATGIGMDDRIGPRFLRAGLGYGGSCFPKDVAAFHCVADQHGVDLQLLQEIVKINENQQEIFFAKILSALWTLRGKRLAVLGLAFKNGTDDIRESPAIAIVRRLLAAGAILTAYDPAAMARTQSVLPPSETMRYAESSYEAAQGADAALILTEWKEFAELDLDRLKESLRFPILIDGRNLFRPQEMAARGFQYISIGRSSLPPAEPQRSAVA